ncbi:sigma factor [Pseudomonas sp. NPDC089401]|uniref:sigma factor n=1 Tax=Pseudomonas sp. NPDC089401 TaxID=3364462 RepID=UPI00382740BF
MTDDYREPCIDRADRASNEELAALLAAAVDGHASALQCLSLQVVPLLLAFYQGQAQAGGLLRDAVDELVQQAWLAVYQRCAGYDPQRPFRAWLIEIACQTLVEHRRRQVAFTPAPARKASARLH